MIAKNSDITSNNKNNYKNNNNKDDSYTITTTTMTNFHGSRVIKLTIIIDIRI